MANKSPDDFRECFLHPSSLLLFLRHDAISQPHFLGFIYAGEIGPLYRQPFLVHICNDRGWCVLLFCPVATTYADCQLLRPEHGQPIRAVCRPSISGEFSR